MQEFFENVARYPRYLISLILGIFFALFEKLKPLFSNKLNFKQMKKILAFAGSNHAMSINYQLIEFTASL